MQQLHVLKTGHINFDFLHAAGLAVLASTERDTEVLLTEQGTFYELSFATGTPSAKGANELIEQTLVVPSSPEDKDESPESQLAWSIFDGLLAATFTSNGIRLISVADAQSKESLRPGSLASGLEKAKQVVNRFKDFVQRTSYAQTDWLQEVLKEYRPEESHDYRVTASNCSDILVSMPIEPSLAYSTRRPLSDGLISQRKNVAVRIPSYAVLLANIGASRFLRGESVAGANMNLYLPLYSSLIIRRDSTESTLPGTGADADQAVLLYWLEAGQREAIQPQSVSYQVLQTQRMMSPISVRSGSLEIEWLNQVKSRAGPSVMHYWQSLLRQDYRQLIVEQSFLLDALFHRSEEEWLRHWQDYEKVVRQARTTEPIRSYSLMEVKEIVQLMSTENVPKLGYILTRERGTLRFGRAFRQLSRSRKHGSNARELMEVLEGVNSQDQLLRVLASLVQECEIASADNPFIIVPNETDLHLLLEDVASHSPREVSSLLLILASLRYPYQEAKTDNNDSDELSLESRGETDD